MAEEQDKKLTVKWSVDSNSERAMVESIKTIRRELGHLVEDANRAATLLSRMGVGATARMTDSGVTASSPQVAAAGNIMGKGIGAFGANATKNLQQTRDYLKGIAGTSAEALEGMTDAVEDSVRRQTEYISKLRNEFNLLGKAYKEVKSSGPFASNARGVEVDPSYTAAYSAGGVGAKGQELAAAMGGGTGGMGKPPGGGFGGMLAAFGGAGGFGPLSVLMRGAGYGALALNGINGIAELAYREPLRRQQDEIRHAVTLGQSAGMAGVATRNGNVNYAYAMLSLARRGQLGNLVDIGSADSTSMRKWQAADSSVGGIMGAAGGLATNAVGTGFAIKRAIGNVNSEQVAAVVKRLQDEVAANPEMSGWVSDWANSAPGRIAAQRAFGTPSYVDAAGRYHDPAQRRINRNWLFTPGEQIGMAQTLRASGGYESEALVDEALSSQKIGILNAPQLLSGAMMGGTDPLAWMKNLRSSGVSRDLAGDAGALTQRMMFEGYGRSGGLDIMGGLSEFLQGAPGEAKYNAKMLNAGLSKIQAGPQDAFQNVVNNLAIQQAFAGENAKTRMMLSERLAKDPAMVSELLKGRIPESLEGYGLDSKNVAEQTRQFLAVRGNEAMDRWTDAIGKPTPIGKMKQDIKTSGLDPLAYINTIPDGATRKKMLGYLGVAEFGPNVDFGTARGAEEVNYASIFGDESNNINQSINDVGASSADVGMLQSQSAAAKKKEEALSGIEGLTDIPKMLAPLADVFKQAADGLTGPGGFTSELQLATTALREFREKGLGADVMSASTDKAAPRETTPLWTFGKI